ncbi:MAG TPA: hypothetical protein VKD90_12210 [Gemmataceae bacterium]|nr:hypothetical protein [Gemmataceae bacterium]
MDTPPEPKQHPFEAAYRGVGSIALGSVPLLMVFPAVQLGYWLRTIRPYPPTASNWVFAVVSVLVLITIFIVLSGFGIIQGLRGRAAAYRTGEPRVLCNVGIVFALLALVGWTMIGYGWCWELERFNFRK